MPIDVTPAERLPVERDVQAFERRTGIRLPGSYRRFLLRYGAGKPVENAYKDDGRIGVERFLSIFPGRGSIEAAIETFDGRILKTAIPIADCVCGNLLLLRPKSGSIWFWDHELELTGDNDGGEKKHTRLAKNIDELLQVLRNASGDALPPMKVNAVKIRRRFMEEQGLSEQTLKARAVAEGWALTIED